MPDSLTIYLDTPIWWWRGRRWCHLISDVSLDNLHSFAREIELRYMSFGFDHYDLPEELVDRAIGAGAELIDARDIVRKLRAAGLRTSYGKKMKMWQPSTLIEVDPTAAEQRTMRHVAAAVGADIDDAVVYARAGEVVVLLEGRRDTGSHPREVGQGLGESVQRVVVTPWRGAWVAEVVIDRPFPAEKTG